MNIPANVLENIRAAEETVKAEQVNQPAQEPEVAETPKKEESKVFSLEKATDMITNLFSGLTVETKPKTETQSKPSNVFDLEKALRFVSI